MGVILPLNNTVLPAELPDRMPDVRFAYERVTVSELSSRGVAAMARLAQEALDRLAEAEVDAVVYACLWTSLVTEESWEAELADYARSVGAGPLATAADAFWRELDRLGAGRLVLLSAYPAGVHEQLCEVARRRGHDVVGDASLGISDMDSLADVRPSDLVDMVPMHSRETVDAVCVVGTDLPTQSAVPLLQKRSGVPVVTSNGAIAHSVAGVLKRTKE